MARFAYIAQATLPVIGSLNNGSPDAFASLFADFRRGLSEAGFVEARTVNIEARWAEGIDDRLPGLVSELVQRRVSVIVATGGSACVMAARVLATTTPIVFVIGADPIKPGIVKSLNQPRGQHYGCKPFVKRPTGKASGDFARNNPPRVSR